MLLITTHERSQPMKDSAEQRNFIHSYIPCSSVLYHVQTLLFVCVCMGGGGVSVCEIGSLSPVHHSLLTNPLAIYFMLGSHSSILKASWWSDSKLSGIPFSSAGKVRKCRQCCQFQTFTKLKNEFAKLEEDL